MTFEEWLTEYASKRGLKFNLEMRGHLLSAFNSGLCSDDYPIRRPAADYGCKVFDAQKEIDELKARVAELEAAADPEFFKSHGAPEWGPSTAAYFEWQGLPAWQRMVNKALGVQDTDRPMTATEVEEREREKSGSGSLSAVLGSDEWREQIDKAHEQHRQVHAGGFHNWRNSKEEKPEPGTEPKLRTKEEFQALVKQMGDTCKRVTSGEAYREIYGIDFFNRYKEIVDSGVDEIDAFSQTLDEHHGRKPKTDFQGY